MPSISGAARMCARLAAIVLISALGGCATFYVDMNMKEVAPANRAAVANPKPVQILFEFQTKGVRNGQATDFVRKQVLETVRGSGAFTDVSDGPVANGAILNIVLNNVPLTDDAYAKGFTTGLTFGLVGTTVGDGYICTADYISAPGAAKITKTNRDAIYTSLGNSSGPPPNVQKMKSVDDAVHLMVRKTVGNAVNDIARDPAFATAAK